jgi:hypothetical protein
VGCTERIQPLAFGETVWVSNLEINTWRYYEVKVPYRTTLLVELDRQGGDPVLFLKPKQQGFVPGGLPTASDFNLFADTLSYRSRLNYHYRYVPSVEVGSYYVGVFNNQRYLNQTADFSIRAVITVSHVCNATAA